MSFLGIHFFSKHVLVTIWGILGIAKRYMNATCIVKRRKFILTVCPSWDILYRCMNLFDCLIQPVTLKPANIPTLGYNNYRNFVSLCSFDVDLQCFSSSRPWKYYKTVLRERFSKGGRYSPALIIIIIIIIKTLFSVGNTISYKLLFLEAHLTKYIQTMKICKQNKARTYIQFVQIRH